MAYDDRRHTELAKLSITNRDGHLEYCVSSPQYYLFSLAQFSSRCPSYCWSRYLCHFLFITAVTTCHSIFFQDLALQYVEIYSPLDKLSIASTQSRDRGTPGIPNCAISLICIRYLESPHKPRWSHECPGTRSDRDSRDFRPTRVLALHQPLVLLPFYECTQ